MGMLPGWFVLFSVLIRLASGGRYCWGVIAGKARPNPVSWFLWGLTAMIAFAASLQNGFTIQALAVLALGISPLAVCCLAVIKYNPREHLTPFTIACAVLALIGIVLWRITNSPQLAIIFSIAADLTSALPTILKAYRNPASEYATPYLMSMASMLITLLTIKNWTFTVFAFPLYMCCFNGLVFCLARFEVRKTVRRLRRPPVLELAEDETE